MIKLWLFSVVGINKREELEDNLWDHLSAEISPEVVKYQVQTQTRRPNSVPVTTADVAAILCNAVKDKNLSEVD